MNIWLIMSGEPLEHFGDRPHRVGILSKILIKLGHNVTWWTTAYDHQHKKYLFNKDTELLSKTGVSMVFLHPKISYKRNISIQRIINYKQVASKFEEISRKSEKPDIILTAYPSIDLAYEAVKYGKEFNVPVVVDIRDMWPDIFLDIVPNILKPMLSVFLKPMYNQARFIFKNADVISAMTDEFIKFGLKYGRKRSDLDKAFPFGYPDFKLQSTDEEIVLEKFKEIGVDFNKFNVCYFGTIGKQFDFTPVIETAQKMLNENIQFIICGVGDNFDNLKNETENITNIILPAWLNQTEIWTLMKFSNVGIAPYVNKYDFLASIPNKFIEYCAGGLPILSSIDGVIGKIIQENDNGIVYHNSSEKLMEALYLLKNNEDLQSKMSKSSRTLYEQKFSADKVYSDMVKHLENIVQTYNLEQK